MFALANFQHVRQYTRLWNLGASARAPRWKFRTTIVVRAGLGVLALVYEARLFPVGKHCGV
jgi:hypothetical protein